MKKYDADKTTAAVKATLKAISARTLPCRNRLLGIGLFKRA
jgi:hypothetical protein